MHASLESIDYVDQKTIGQQGLFEKFRVQLPTVLVATVTLQCALAPLLYGSFVIPANAQNSILISIVANFVGLISYRRLRLYPGTRRLAFILPSFAFAWSFALAFLVLARVPYSSAQLAIGVTTATFFALLLNAWNRRPDMAAFLVIPSPRTSAFLEEFPDLRHRFCRSADDISGLDYNTIIADLHSDMPASWESALARAALSGKQIFHVKHVFESLSGRVQVEHLSENVFGSLAPDPSYALIKGLVERFLALVTLLVASPIVLCACIAIRFESQGPALFKQTRIGYRGKPFTIYKLRTMAHSTAPATRESDVTVANDPRITRLGRFLRYSRIDEIPQLFNVLRGEMSLIGPRPETANLSAWYAESIDFYAYRHIVLPGITGWAQVKQGHVASTDDVILKLQYDFYYIKNFSLWLDLVIVLKTMKVMLFKLGAK